MRASARSAFAVEQGQRGPSGQHQVAVAGLVASLQEAEPAVEHRAETRRARLEQPVGLQDQPFGEAVGVSEPRTDGGDLVTESGALGAGARLPQGVVARQQAGDERLVVVGLSDRGPAPVR